MENTGEKPSKQRKILIGVGLFLILVALPAVSWIYLSKGVNWRRTAVAELSNYGKIRSAFIIWPDQTKEDLLKGKVVVLHVFDENPDLTDANRKIIDTGEKLYNQFNQNPRFRLGMVSGKGTAEFLSYAQTQPSAGADTWVWTRGVGAWNPVVTKGYESFCRAENKSPDAEYFALTDTSGMIRRYYNALDDKQIERMVQHIAILLPNE